MKKQKKVLWICRKNTPILESLALILQNYSFNTIFCYNLNQFLELIGKNRVTTVILDGSLPKEDLHNFISLFSSESNLRSVRWVLGFYKQDPHLFWFAASNNARDIIPMDLNPALWVKRFLFSTASQGLNFSLPSYRWQMTQPITLNVPARIVWMTSSRVALELNAKLNLGSVYQLQAPVFQKFGVKKIEITPFKLVQYSLYSRFHFQVQANLNLSKVEEIDYINFINHENVAKPLSQIRIFAAISDNGIRRQLEQELKDSRFNVNFPLQVKHIFAEPPYYRPDVIIIEDHVLSERTLSKFIKVFSEFDFRCRILILGPDSRELSSKLSSQLKYKVASLEVYSVEKILPDLLAIKPQDSVSLVNEKGLFLYKQAEESIASLRIGGTLKMIHPSHVVLQPEVAISNYSMVQCYSATLGSWLSKKIWLKLVEKQVTKEKSSEQESYVAYFCNLNIKDQVVLKDQLLRFIKGVLERYLEPLVDLDKTQEVEKQDFVDEGASQESNQELAQLTKVESLSKRPLSSDLEQFDEAAESYEIQKFPSRKKKSGKRYLLYFMMFSAFWFMFFRSCIPDLATMKSHSGGVFTEQLKKFKGDKKDGE